MLKMSSISDHNVLRSKVYGKGEGGNGIVTGKGKWNRQDVKLVVTTLFKKPV